MTGFLSLHRLAKERGDGLHPALLTVMERQRMIARESATIADIAQRRGDHQRQAGPHPVSTMDAELPDCVVRLAPQGLKTVHGRRVATRP